MVAIDSSERGGSMQSYQQTHPLYDKSPLLLPRSATWNSIRVEHHVQPPGECALRLPQHTLCILLRGCRTERRMSSQHLFGNQPGNGELIIYPAFSEQWVRWQGDAEFLLLFLDPGLVTETASELVPHGNIELIEREKEVLDPLILQIGLSLKAEIDEGMVDSAGLYAESLASALSAHLLRRYSVWKPLTRDLVGEQPLSRFQHVIDYIQDNLAQNLTLAELSFVANMSTYHFARTFKQAVGVTPHQYVLSARIERAKELLKQGKLSIADVASRVGFFDQSHFTRYFKRIVGVTPQTLLRESSKNIPSK